MKARPVAYMPTIALVTDTAADLPPTLHSAPGMTVVPASAGFADGVSSDAAFDANRFYARMQDDGATPRTFGVTEAAFRDAFTSALEAGAEAVACMIMPFDVTPSFTTASAAMLAIQESHPGAVIKVMNPGVASAGLCALLTTLAPAVAAGCDLRQLLALVDKAEPGSDSLFVPADTRWLEQAGRLAIIEDRIGPLEGRVPVVRVGTRITGVAAALDFESAIVEMVDRAGARAEGAPLVAVVDHAAAPEVAAHVAALLRARWEVASLTITELSPTIGSQVGPGAVGVGVAPFLGDANA